MGNKNTSNNQTNGSETNSTINNNNNNTNDFINLIHNKLTTTCNDSPLHQRVWYERQQLSNNNNNNTNMQRCSLLRQLEQDQQQVQRLAKNFESKCNDCNNNNNNNNNNDNNNINNNNKNKTTRFASNSFRLPNVEKSSLSPLQYVKRKFSMRKRDKECSSRKAVTSFPSSPLSSSSLSPPAALSSPSSSSSSPVSSSSSPSSSRSPEFMETCLLSSPELCTSLNNNNNNYTSNNNIDVIEGYLITGSSTVDHLDYSLLPVLSSYQYKLPYTSRDYMMQTGNMPFYEKESVGQDDEWLSRNDGKVDGRDDERHQQTNVENMEWMVDAFPVMSSPSWKMKNKIRTNPWIAQSSTATPPSSPDTAHLTNPGASMKNQLLRNRCPLKANQDAVLNDSKKQDSKPKQSSFEGARLDDDLNSEGYYSSSFGSLSVHSADSPGLSPLKAKKLNPEYNDDSGFFSMLNSCTSYQSPEEEEEEEGEEEEAEPSQCSESDDSETTTEDGLLARSPSVDEVDMPLPCSRDLIAINKLLRMKEMQKQAPVENLESQAACGCDGFSGGSECKDDDGGGLDYIFADEMWRSSMSSRSLQRRISFEVENQIFELRHDFYDEVFAESQGQLTMDEPVVFQQQQQQPEQLIQTSITHSFSDEANDSEEEDDDGNEDTTVVNSNRRTLEDIQTTLETSYMDLWIQEKKIREAVERQREEEKLKKKELKMMREKSLENKKLYLLETLQRLKSCLDQQKTWLQRTYDNILEKKWPVLHQIRG